jgi:hypothetical protein
MANGFFQPKQNRFLLASQLFRQAPTTHWTGALAQALGGLTAGVGQRKQQADIEGQQRAFQQALMGSLPAGQQPTGIPAQPTQMTGGVNPQVISQLIAGGQPQMAAQLVEQAKAQQLASQQAAIAREQQLADVAGGQQFKTDILGQQQEFQAIEAEKDRQLKRDLANLQLQVEGMKPENLTPFEKEIQVKTAGELSKAKTGFLDVKNTHADVSNKLKMIEATLPQALTGGWVPIKQTLRRFTNKSIAEKLGIPESKIIATRNVESNLKSMVGAVLKATFGGVVSEGEREFLRDSFAKETQTEDEIRRSLDIIQKWQNMALRNASAKLNNLVGTAQQFTKQIDIGGFGAGGVPAPAQTQRVKVSGAASKVNKILQKDADDFGINI